MTIIEMRVRMDCPGCEAKVKRALQKLKGIDDIDIDMSAQKVTVMGWADQKKVLKAVRKTGRRAELWPYPYNPESYYYYNYYYQQQPYESEPPQVVSYETQSKTTSSSYNYYKDGYSDADYGYYQVTPYSSLVDEQASAMFSDDNPHACSIM